MYNLYKDYHERKMEKYNRYSKYISKKAHVDFIKNPVNEKYLSQIFNELEKKTLSESKLINNKHLLPTAIKFSSYSYYSLEVESLVKLPFVYYNSQLMIAINSSGLYITLRGTDSSDPYEIYKDIKMKRNKVEIDEQYKKKYNTWKKRKFKNHDFTESIGKKSVASDFLYHTGFMELYQKYDICRIVIKYIEKYIKQYKKLPKILMVGHSLGGSFIKLLILDLIKFNKKLKFYCITFGEPPSMNSNMSLFFQYLGTTNIISYIRIYNSKDIIVNVKTDYSKFKFIGSLRHIDTCNDKKKCKSNILSLDLCQYIDKFIKGRMINPVLYHKYFAFGNQIYSF